MRSLSPFLIKGDNHANHPRQPNPAKESAQSPALAQLLAAYLRVLAAVGKLDKLQVFGNHQAVMASQVRGWPRYLCLLSLLLQMVGRNPLWAFACSSFINNDCASLFALGTQDMQ